MKWIKASDRLPETGKDVCCKIKHMDLYDTGHYTGSYMVLNHFGAKINDVIEWLDESTQEDNGWISVEDRLPTKEDAPNGVILAVWENDYVQIIFLNDLREQNTHWQPLPLAPNTKP